MKGPNSKSLLKTSLIMAPLLMLAQSSLASPQDCVVCNLTRAEGLGQASLITLGKTANNGAMSIIQALLTPSAAQSWRVGAGFQSNPHGRMNNLRPLIPLGSKSLPDAPVALTGTFDGQKWFGDAGRRRDQALEQLTNQPRSIPTVEERNQAYQPLMAMPDMSFI